MINALLNAMYNLIFIKIWPLLSTVPLSVSISNIFKFKRAIRPYTFLNWAKYNWHVSTWTECLNILGGGINKFHTNIKYLQFIRKYDFKRRMQFV